MPHLGFIIEVEQLCKTLLTGQSRDRQRRYKFPRGFCQNDARFHTRTAKLADQLQAFERGDTAKVILKTKRKSESSG